MKQVVAALGVAVPTVFGMAAPASGQAAPAQSPSRAMPEAMPAATAPAQLPGVPAASVLARGRVLVLRPHRLEVAVDGRLQREIPLSQPLDLSRLPDVVGDPAIAVRTGPGAVRLGAVLLQRPGTTLEAGAGGPLRLELGDTGGAGPARLTGTRAALHLRGVTLTNVTGSPPMPSVPSVPFVAAGLRYLHESDLRLEDVTLDGLGRPGVPALREDGGRLALVRVAVSSGGPGVQVGQPVALTVDGLQARTGGVALTVVGGRNLAFAGLRLAGAPDARVLKGSTGVVVRAGVLRAARDAVRASDSRDVVLQGTATSGAVRGAKRGPGDAAPDPGRDVGTATRGSSLGTRSSWRPVRGATAVALLVLAGAIVLEVAWSWRRPQPRTPGRPGGWDPGELLDDTPVDLGVASPPATGRGDDRRTGDPASG
ncbi:MAG: hypothetical protein ACXV3A_04720 [Kineosporiaceae bacterium]